jgi:hypothetical protein
MKKINIKEKMEDQEKVDIIRYNGNGINQRNDGIKIDRITLKENSKSKGNINKINDMVKIQRKDINDY